MRILIVDDSRTARAICRRLLPREGVEITEAGGGAEALERIGREQFDVMLLDLTMPEMDGFDVLARMQSLDAPPPVIVLSADAQPKAQERVLALGARGFVKKPGTAGEIASALKGIGL